MKSIVGFAFFLLFLAGFAFVFLQGKQSRPPLAHQAGPLSFMDVHWRPVSVGDVAVADDTVMFVRFETHEKITGHAGCNRFFGSFEVQETGFQVGPLGSTRMACPEPVMSIEQEFLRAIEEMKHFLTSPDSMQLLDGDNDTLARFVPANPAPSN